MDNQHLYAGNNFQIYHHDEQKYFDRRMGSPRHYINYLAKGNVRYVTTRGTFEFKAGDFYYIPMGTAYEFYNWGRQNCEIHSCGFSLFPETRTKKFKFQNLPSQYIPEFLQIPLQRLPDTPTLVKFYGLLEKLLPHLQEDQIGSPLLESLTKMILQDPTARIPALARQCGLAESTLYVHIKKQTGKTPNEYRKAYRSSYSSRK